MTKLRVSTATRQLGSFFPSAAIIGAAGCVLVL
jgi:hypothetical protein